MELIMTQLEEKTDLLRHILTETQRQGEMLSANDLDSLIVSIDARQAYMDSVDELDGRIRSLGGPVAQESSDVLAQRVVISDLLKAIMKEDLKNSDSAGELMQSFMNGIRKARAERNLLAYVPSGGQKYKFVNKRG
jgi:hypothetical protein